MRRDQLSGEPGDHVFFVYHPGNEWRPTFHALNTTSPLPQLCGVFDELDTLAAWLQFFRKVAGPELAFHVLMPATELYVVPDGITWPEEVHPMIFEGEKRNGGGLPYVHFNMPGARKEMFSYIRKVADEKPVPPPRKPSAWRWVASTSAAWAAGVPAAVVATPGGLMVGVGCGVGCVALAPVIATEAVCIGIMHGGGAVAGVAAGTVTGLSVGKKVEEAWDSAEKTDATK
jgi:hypothetical protein